jgi:hypothetical protein
MGCVNEAETALGLPALDIDLASGMAQKIGGLLLRGQGLNLRRTNTYIELDRTKQKLDDLDASVKRPNSQVKDQLKEGQSSVTSTGQWEQMHPSGPASPDISLRRRGENGTEKKPAGQRSSRLQKAQELIGQGKIGKLGD